MPVALGNRDGDNLLDCEQKLCAALQLAVCI